MTNPDLTLVGILVDRSGSMRSIASQMSSAINEFIDTQRSQPGECEVTLAQFDDKYEMVYDLRPIANMSPYSLSPRGWTALNDGIGKFVTDIGAILAKRPVSKRPGKVVILIVTDGYENHSKEWTTAQIKDLVDEQKANYSWEFMFLGKDIDAFAVADSIGIARGQTINFANAGNTVTATSNLVSSYRAASAGAVMDSYTEQDRIDAVTP